MGFLAKIFNVRATAVALAAGIVAAVAGGGPAQALGDPDEGGIYDNCINGHRQYGPFSTDSQIRLELLFRQAGQGSVGGAVAKDILEDYTLICLDSRLIDKRDECGNRLGGAYIPFLNAFKLSPADEDAMLVLTSVHEGRHKQQDDLYLGDIGSANIREAERIKLGWLEEADARAASIVYAWEKERQGDSTYMNALTGKRNLKHMVEAFRHALEQKPGDVEEAIRAAIKAFRTSKKLAFYYDKAEAEWIEKKGLHFDPSRPEQILINMENLRRLGRMGEYDYINEDLVAFVKASVTDQDYGRLRQAMLKAQENGEPFCSLS